MNLVDIYKDLCRNNRWYDAYCSTGENSNGKIKMFSIDQECEIKIYGYLRQVMMFLKKLKI